MKQIAGITTQELAPKTLDEVMALAEVISKATIIPKDYQGNPGNIVIAYLWGKEINLGMLQSMQSICVINGRPSVYGDAMLAIVRGSGLLEDITETLDEHTRTAICTIKRKGETPAVRTFSMDDAKRASLDGKPGPWKQYPKRMLQMRARSWALRDVFPDVLRGVHIAEEARDIPPEKYMGKAELVTRPDSVDAPADDHDTDVDAYMDADEPNSQALSDILAAFEEAMSKTDIDAAAVEASKLESSREKTKARDGYVVALNRIKAADKQRKLDKLAEVAAQVNTPENSPPATVEEVME